MLHDGRDPESSYKYFSVSDLHSQGDLMIYLGSSSSNCRTYPTGKRKGTMTFKDFYPFQGIS